MSPVINKNPHQTGTLPKNNRHSERNRYQSMPLINASAFNAPNLLIAPECLPEQRDNNVFQFNWQTLASQETGRTAKNSNTKSTHSASQFPVSVLEDLGFYNNPIEKRSSGGFPSEATSWIKMTPPVEPQTIQNMNPVKSNNVDKLPNRGQVENRLKQIRDYIKMTSSMMDSLSQCTDTNGESENPDTNKEQELLKKVEESQRKLVQLQEHQSQLDAMQNSVKERLDAARQAQRELLENQVESANVPEESKSESVNAIQLEQEAEALRNKLAQLQSKKIRMDHLVAELQAAEALEQASSSSDNLQTDRRNKEIQLEAMKAQLSHLKAMMDGVNEVHDSLDENEVEPIREAVINNIANGEMYQMTNDPITNSYLESNKSEETYHNKQSTEAAIDQIQAVTQELKEQSALLQLARNELRLLKQGQAGQINSSSLTSTTPPLSLPNGTFEKKRPNNVSIPNGRYFSLEKGQAIDDYIKKEIINNNQNNELKWENHRDSSSQQSHISAPANLWPLATNVTNNSRVASNDNVSENLLELNSQPLTENNFGANYWGFPSIPNNQNMQGSTEYYRQLLMGSQSQQLQMMCTTIQQCCQLLWAQQRELDSLRSAMSQMQLQMQKYESNDMQPQIVTSNINRSNQRLSENIELDGTTLPNLISLPNALSTISAQSTVSQSPQRLEQTQLNNQVPPGNRANNYWDNFRSYSRQNLLSANSKTAVDNPISTALNTTTLSGSASGTVNSSIAKEKSNHGSIPESSPINFLEEIEALRYPQNFQTQLNFELNRRDKKVKKNSGVSRDKSQRQQENVKEENAFHLDSGILNDESYLKVAKKISKRDDLKLILVYCLKTLECKKSSSPTPSTILSSSDLSDDESEIGACAISPTHQSNDNLRERHENVIMNSADVDHNMQTVYEDSFFIDQLALPENGFTFVNSADPSTTASTIYNQDLNDTNQLKAELDQYVNSSGEENANLQILEESLLNISSTVDNNLNFEKSRDQEYINFETNANNSILSQNQITLSLQTTIADYNSRLPGHLFEYE